MEFALMAAAASGGGVFQYNRKNFQFDGDLNMEKTFQGMEMKIKQFELYREDVRDLVDLTVKKMDNYLIVNTLQLGFAITMFTEGRPEPEEAKEHPPWLLFLWTICNLGSFMYYLLSMWLAMHASVAAHSFGVRLLTQFVRLPVPNSEQLDEARALSKDYETKGAKDLFRIPVWKQQMSRMQRQMETLTTDEMMTDFPEEDFRSSNPVAQLEHIQQFRRLQANWQSYDAYARVSMALGTNMTMMAFSYYCLGILTVQNSVPWSALSCVVVFTTTAWVLARLDLYLSRTILATAGFLLAAPPILCLGCTFLFKSGHHTWERILVPFIYALHVLWALFCLAIAKADHMTESVALPTKFRSVLYLDVFGWLRDGNSGHPDDADLVDGGRRRRRERLNVPVVQVSEPQPAASSSAAASSSQSPDEVQALPPVAARLIVEQCHALFEELEQELACWEEPQTIRMMKEQPQLHDCAKEHRARFDQIGAQFQEALAAQQLSADVAAVGPRGRPPTWLKLQWNHNGHPHPYYYNRATEGTWMPPNEDARPGDGGRVSDLERMDLKLNLLADDVGALSGKQPSQRADRVLPGDSTADVHQNNETHTFHPGQHASDSRSHGNLQRRPVGRMPWHTFLQGSLLMISMWTIATIWSICNSISGQDILRAEPGHPGAAHLMMNHLNPELVSDMEWPHAFFRPSSLACNPRSGSLGLITESYAVHQVQLGRINASSETTVQTSLNECFEEARAFIGHGLSSVSLKCHEAAGGNTGAACSALFLSGDGQSTLQCNTQLATAERGSALGGKWRALAAGEGDVVWALGADALVQLRPRPGASHQLMPRFDIPFKGASSLKDLHVHGQTWLLGLAAERYLHAWPLGGGPEHRYRLPRDVKWSSVCSTEEKLFLTGLNRDGKAGVWSFDIPSRLARELPPPSGKWTRWLLSR